MKQFAHHKYTWTKPWGQVRHQWQLVSRDVAVHFHATISGKEEWDDSAGLEFHFRHPPENRRNDAPDQIRCWLLECACWHDGTSLYAKETLWPVIKLHLERGDHESIFRLLEREIEERYGREREEEAA